MGWIGSIMRRVRGETARPIYDGTGAGRRASAWQVPNPGAVAALVFAQDGVRAKSRDLARRNPWAVSGIDALVTNLIGTGIKPQSMIVDPEQRAAVQALWREWTAEADVAELTDFYGLQALATQAMIEGGDVICRLRYRRPEDGLSVGLQVQLLESEHLPMTLNQDLPNGNIIRAGIEFNRLGQRVAFHLYRSHPNDAGLAAMSSTGGLDTARVPANEIILLFRPRRPGQIRGESWLARALVKLDELDQYDDAELVRKKTAAMFAGFITRMSPEDSMLGEGDPDEAGVAMAGLEPGTMQMLEPGEDVRFSEPADVGGSYSDFMRWQFRAVAVAMGVTYEQLTGDLTGVNYSSIRAGLLEFRRRCEQLQHGVIVHQFCRRVWQAWMDQAVMEGALLLPGYARNRRAFQRVQWVPDGWQWVDPLKEVNAFKQAVRAGFVSRSSVVSANGDDAEDIDADNAADNARADSLGLVYDSDARHDQSQAPSAAPPSNEPPSKKE